MVLLRIQHSTIPITWTNNQCEATDHILKLEIDWKLQKVYTLVDSIKHIVQLWLADIRQALHQQGNYQLAAHVQHLQIAHVCWSEKMQEEKDKWFQEFVEYKSRKRPHQITSTLNRRKSQGFTDAKDCQETMSAYQNPCYQNQDQMLTVMYLLDIFGVPLFPENDFILQNVFAN